jgi:hypothetical protein
VRPDGDRFVLVEGLHRLEACKALGEETILGFLVGSPQGGQQKASSPYDAEVEALRLKTERLKKLRLAKVAEEKASAQSVAPNEQHAPAGTAQQGSFRRAAASSPSVTLAEWLARQDRDGFRS